MPELTEDQLVKASIAFAKAAHNYSVAFQFIASADRATYSITSKMPELLEIYPVTPKEITDKFITTFVDRIAKLKEIAEGLEKQLEELRNKKILEDGVNALEDYLTDDFELKGD